MSKTTQNIKTWVLAASLGLGAAVSAHAQSSVIVRTSSFEYDTEGLLVQEVIEPDSPQHCLQTSHSYNALGNPSGTSSSPCAGASGHTLASAGTRSTTKEYLAQTVVIDGVSHSTPAGVFATRTTNALNQSESYEYDPRHGKMTKLTGPNGGVTTWAYDGFGRKTREYRADGTYTVWEYKLCKVLGQPLDSVCAVSVSNGGLTHAHEWYVKEVSYGTNDVPLAAAKYQIHDTMGRVVRVRSDSFMSEGYAANRYGTVQDTVYNALGQTVYKSIAYLLTGGNPQWTSYEYDELGRVTKETSPDGSGGTAVLQTAYNGLQTVITNALGQVKTVFKNASGQTERIEDALGTPVQYTYDAMGRLIQTNANGSITKLSYDVRGRKTGMQDPAMGRWDYAYNAFGELVWQQDSLSQVVTMQYDALGRMSKRSEPDLVSNWYYDSRADGTSCGAGIGKLCEATANNGYRRLHTYDAMGRPTSTSNVLDNAAQPAVTSQVYDSVTGRLIEQTWPTGYKAIYEYTTAGANWSAGHLWRVRGMDGATQNALWQAMDKDPQGRLIRYQDGNGVVTLKNIEQATGKTHSLKSTLTGAAEGNVLDHSYTYDKLNNLLTRSDANTGVAESFSYDSLNRLSLTSTLGGGLTTQQQVQVLYDARGNIKYKSDVGYYHYDVQRPNRLTQITTTGTLEGVTVANTGTKALAYAFDDYLPGVQSIDLGQGNVAMGNGNLMYTVSQDSASGAHTVRWEEYTSFNKIRQMRFGSLSNPNDPTNAVADRTVDLVYGPEHQRLRQTVQLTSNAPSHMEAGTTWYMNGPDSLGLSYEKEVKANGLIEHKHYLSAGGEVFAQYTKREGNLNGKPAQQVSYFHQDHLGSLAVITNEAGQVIERLAYDPWGKRRNADGSRDNNDTLTSSNTKRGYTMHEHMDEMGVINMNGRVYDSTTGRFLTTDRFVEAPEELQSYNRYGYVHNNPLSKTDPTGYFSVKVVSAFAFAMLNSFTQSQSKNSSKGRQKTLTLVLLGTAPSNSGQGALRNSKVLLLVSADDRNSARFSEPPILFALSYEKNGSIKMDRIQINDKMAALTVGKGRAPDWIDAVIDSIGGGIRDAVKSRISDYFGEIGYKDGYCSAVTAMDRDDRRLARSEDEMSRYGEVNVNVKKQEKYNDLFKDGMADVGAVGIGGAFPGYREGYVNGWMGARDDNRARAGEFSCKRETSDSGGWGGNFSGGYGSSGSSGHDAGDSVGGI